MYSGLLPKGLSDAEISADDEGDQSVYSNQEIFSKCPAVALAPATKDNCTTFVDTRSYCTPTVIQNEMSSDCLPGISEEKWQKFKELKKKNDEIKSNKFPIKRSQKRHRHKKDDKSRTKNMESKTEREPQAEHEKHWDGLTKYFGTNDRFQPPACSKPAPKSGLEKSIENAIAEGDIGKAEEMSDRLASRELAVKITQAADCRDFVQSKQEAEASRAAQKRKKQIAWGFEAKQRWETKSNMGYM
ncbi:protein FAM204A [Esox lucius]|uniref:C10orf84 homolog n=1 Tax=Esox lucius TaxID=8010 RepID=C1BY84_ESOLU|nr:protein FAM204A [Esox lucius]ACO13987.1 C10orf84 homolog [Esox lucius]